MPNSLKAWLSIDMFAVNTGVFLRACLCACVHACVLVYVHAYVLYVCVCV